MGSSPTFTLPVTAVSHTTNYPIAWGQILDSGTGSYISIAQYATTTTAQMRYFDAAAAGNAIAVSTPFAWANNDQISLFGTYEAA